MLINSITKKYKGTVALNKLSFNFKQGEIVGLIGNNGAGKSTLMKIISQTIQEFDGSIKDNHRVGYLIEEPKLFSNKTGLAHLSYFSRIYGNKFEMSEYEQLLKGLQLFDVLNKKVKQYSLGMKQKLGIVISLLNNPNYVVLDEPTNGMDIETSLEVLEQLKKMARERNVGILISSHKLEDIENVCNRVLFLEKGNIVEEQQVNNKRHHILKLVFNTPIELAKFIHHQEFGTVIYSSENTVEIETEADNADVFQFLNQLDIKVIDFTTEKKTLRNVYMSKLGGGYHGN
ncbi:ABC transporter ATP-binding protein [Priestia koreensis]|uniref:ABC transporter ATP-binding protein n=1 Tax=Priestia koreensis TaxID=284581 RepID=UPI001F5A710A|nr:ABC transporter ATP-binding protein [Priestia koreensis]MCM3003309.1 ABC transporter ATP-binding protein [Priestia koreensis]UNL86107.1 ABC transporter ATP-binding protein [Priestia koreensis]